METLAFVILLPNMLKLYFRRRALLLRALRLPSLLPRRRPGGLYGRGASVLKLLLLHGQLNGSTSGASLLPSCATAFR